MHYFQKIKKCHCLFTLVLQIASLKWQYKVLFGIKKLFLLFHMMEGEMVASVASIEGRACMLDGGP